MVFSRFLFSRKAAAKEMPDSLPAPPQFERKGCHTVNLLEPLEGSYPCWVIEEDSKAEAAHSMLEAARKLHAAAQKAAVHESTRVTRDDSPLLDTKSTEGKNTADASAGGEKPEEAGQEEKPGEAGEAGGKEASAEVQDEVTQGEQLCANGGAYIGGFKGGKRHGIGICRQVNDYSYEGEWANDQICGQGRETYPNGDSYEGGFLSGMRHGFGCYRTEKDVVYTGQWKQNMKEGLGEMNYSGGGFYWGNFASDKPNGRGSYRYGDGSAATGTFRNGLLHGAGSVDFPDGSAYTGSIIPGGFPRSGGTEIYKLGDLHWEI